MSALNLKMTVLKPVEEPDRPINLHQSASGDSPVKGQLKAGDTVMCTELDDLSGCWVRVDGEGGGWCHLRDLVPMNGKDLPWLRIAQREIGVTEKTSAGRIRAYLDSVTVKPGKKPLNLDHNWCACFINWCMNQAGKKYRDSPMALSWRSWGIKRDMTKPLVGDIAIGETGTPGGETGHIGMLIAYKKGDTPQNSFLLLLGGNQDEAVRYKWFPAATMPDQPYGKFLALRYPE